MGPLIQLYMEYLNFKDVTLPRLYNLVVPTSVRESFSKFVQNPIPTYLKKPLAFVCKQFYSGLVDSVSYNVRSELDFTIYLWYFLTLFGLFIFNQIIGFVLNTSYTTLLYQYMLYTNYTFFVWKLNLDRSPNNRSNTRLYTEKFIRNCLTWIVLDVVVSIIELGISSNPESGVWLSVVELFVDCFKNSVYVFDFVLIEHTYMPSMSDRISYFKNRSIYYIGLGVLSTIMFRLELYTLAYTNLYLLFSTSSIYILKSTPKYEYRLPKNAKPIVMDTEDMVQILISKVYTYVVTKIVGSE